MSKMSQSLGNYSRRITLPSGEKALYQVRFCGRQGYIVTLAHPTDTTLSIPVCFASTAELARFEAHRAINRVFEVSPPIPPRLREPVFVEGKWVEWVKPTPKLATESARPAKPKIVPEPKSSIPFAYRRPTTYLNRVVGTDEFYVGTHASVKLTGKKLERVAKFTTPVRVLRALLRGTEVRGHSWFRWSPTLEAVIDHAGSHGDLPGTLTKLRDALNVKGC